MKSEFRGEQGLHLVIMGFDFLNTGNVYTTLRSYSTGFFCRDTLPLLYALYDTSILL